MNRPSEFDAPAAKAYDEPSVFVVENLLREARRQRALGEQPVPAVCLLDPDGDVVRHLRATGQAVRHEDWACYHTTLWVTTINGRDIGIVACAVGAPFAVLVAEELHASGCSLIVSVTSAGVIKPLAEPPYFMLIERALRDEGTSVHYVAPSQWSHLAPHLSEALEGTFSEFDETIHRGSSWTTDAPFRETEAAITHARRAGAHAVEMEAAALYAYAHARHRDVVCIAHVTNSMATHGDDFEKGEANGTLRILSVVDAISVRLQPSPQ